MAAEMVIRLVDGSDAGVSPANALPQGPTEVPTVSSVGPKRPEPTSGSSNSQTGTGSEKASADASNGNSGLIGHSAFCDSMEEFTRRLEAAIAASRPSAKSPPATTPASNQSSGSSSTDGSAADDLRMMLSGAMDALRRVSPKWLDTLLSEIQIATKPNSTGPTQNSEPAPATNQPARSVEQHNQNVAAITNVKAAELESLVAETNRILASIQARSGLAAQQPSNASGSALPSNTQATNQPASSPPSPANAPTANQPANSANVPSKTGGAQQTSSPAVQPPKQQPQQSSNSQATVQPAKKQQTFSSRLLGRVGNRIKSRYAKSPNAQKIVRGASSLIGRAARRASNTRLGQRFAASSAGKALGRGAARMAARFGLTAAAAGGVGAAGTTAAGAGVGAAAAGTASVAAIAPPVAIAVAAIGAMTAAALAANRALSSMADGLEKYSQNISVAKARQQMNTEINMMDRARRVGPALGAYEEAKGRLNNSLERLATQILDKLSPLVYLAGKGVDALTVISSSFAAAIISAEEKAAKAYAVKAMVTPDKDDDKKAAEWGSKLFWDKFHLLQTTSDAMSGLLGTNPKSKLDTDLDALFKLGDSFDGNNKGN